VPEITYGAFCISKEFCGVAFEKMGGELFEIKMLFTTLNRHLKTMFDPE